MLSKPLSLSNRSIAAVFRRRLFNGSLLRPLSATAASNEAEKSNHFMVDYLISSCGFSSAEASKALKDISHLKSTEKPDSFLRFMRSRGFDDAQIRKIVAFEPRYLCKDVDNTLAPKFRSLESIGFSPSDVTSVVASNPGFLHYRVDSALLQRIEFWESLLGSRDALMKVFTTRGGCWLLPSSVEERAVHNLSLLRKCNIPEERIASLLQRNPRIMLMKPEKFSAIVEQVERMGIPQSSRMFVWGLSALTTVSKARLDANLNLMKRFGWSEADFLSAFCQAPNFSALSQKSLSDKMSFLVKEVGLEPSEVASAPMLLLCSLEKRAIPRHRIIKILESRKLLDKKCKLITVVSYSEKVFMEKYVTPFKGKVPELEEIITKGRGGEDATS